MSSKTLEQADTINIMVCTIIYDWRIIILKYGEINPLAVFGLRELDYCPPHFVQVEFDLRANEKTITDWIWANLDGRFWYGDWYYKTIGDSVNFRKCAAFEIPGEASFFAIQLDMFNKYDNISN
jgi:hypothetical protein